jgi:hypothetical protein
MKNYYIVLDTETANGFVTEDGKLNLNDSLVYDIGFNIIDKKGNVYERYSFAIRDIFCGMAEMMKSAYYAEKIPKYWEDIKAKKRQIVSFMTAYKIVREKIKQYNIKAVSAHNARFDVNALNNTIRYITKSRIRYFFPRNVEIYDTYKAALKTLCTQKYYKEFCEKNNYMTKHKVPRVRATAEVLYKYISGNYDFIEEHQGIYDVDIESKILVQILRQHSKVEYLKLYA